MRLNLVLDTDNAAFDGDQLGPEVSRILIKYANSIKEVVDPDTSIDLETRLRDINGNDVGYIKWIE
tara:strand:+ start:739 stop:936 length:198 start_codon:yes stop_codon:yes gene_type:complete